MDDDIVSRQLPRRANTLPAQVRSFPGQTGSFCPGQARGEDMSTGRFSAAAENNEVLVSGQLVHAIVEDARFYGPAAVANYENQGVVAAKHVHFTPVLRYLLRGCDNRRCLIGFQKHSIPTRSRRCMSLFIRTSMQVAVALPF